jgi:hypothetical protein
MKHFDPVSTAGGFAPPDPRVFATAGGLRAPRDPRVFLTDSSDNPFSSTDLHEGKVGRRELGAGSKREFGLAVRDGKTSATLRNQPTGKATSLSAPSPKPRRNVNTTRITALSWNARRRSCESEDYSNAAFSGAEVRSARMARLLGVGGL